MSRISRDKTDVPWENKLEMTTEAKTLRAFIKQYINLSAKNRLQERGRVMVLVKAKGLGMSHFHSIFNSIWRDEQRSRKRDMRKEEAKARRQAHQKLRTWPARYALQSQVAA